MRNLTYLRVALVTIMLFAMGSAISADFAKGQELYGSLGCAGCHGDKSGSHLDGYPSLVGAKAKFIVSELNKYRNGVRNDPTMTAMAAGLSDKNIEDLSEYIANR